MYKTLRPMDKEQFIKFSNNSIFRVCSNSNNVTELEPAHKK